MSNLDQQAVRIILRGGKDVAPRLRRIAERARRAACNEVDCPECGDSGPHEDNGCSGADRSRLCRACRTQFDEVTS